MHRIASAALTFAVAACTSSSALLAQSILGVPVRFGAMGGTIKPVGTLGGDEYHAWDAGGLIAIGAPSSHMSVRLDGEWAQMRGFEDAIALQCLACAAFTRRTDFRVFSSTANLVYSGPFMGPARFYLIGGVGAYNERGTHLETSYQQMSIEHSSRQENVTRFGVNGGVGASFRLARHAAFFEARYHNLFGRRALNESGFSGGSPTSFQYIPINIGFVF